MYFLRYYDLVYFLISNFKFCEMLLNRFRRGGRVMFVSVFFVVFCVEEMGIWVLVVMNFY